MFGCRWSAWVLAAVAAAGSWGCESDGLLAVQVRSDLVPGVEVDRFTAEVATAEGGAVVGTVERAVAVDTELLEATLSVGELGLPSGVYLVRAYAWRDGSQVAEGFGRASVDGAQAVVVDVERRCIVGLCPGPTDPPQATECRHGRCVSPDCEELGTCASECTADAECPAPTAACAQSRCLDGTCFSDARPGACAAGRYCDPDRGCLPLPGAETDAGVDAGPGPMDDAGPGPMDDAGPPDVDAGPTCEPPGMDCDGDGICDSVRNDPLNCGFCGRECGAGEECCGTECVDVSDDLANCGACFAGCATGETCEAGRCRCGTTAGGVGEGRVCPGGFLGACCDGACVYVSSDTANCGGCGIRCAYGETCSSQDCVCGEMRGTAGGGAVCSGSCCAGECSCETCC
ncbi:MAG TPA: hypothetical protein RMH99_19055 [Sandaracinaceae bacterium LLY-WYZ-13_1]|nr:hypothetical protein [Sandaracinaceae bacterium LLY-WYZ-13_1]